MKDLLEAVKDTPIPTILIVSGIFFFFIAIGGQFGARIITKKTNKKMAAGFGLLFLLVGLWLQFGQPREGKAEQTTASTSNSISEPSGTEARRKDGNIQGLLIGIWSFQDQIVEPATLNRRGTIQYSPNGSYTKISQYSGQVSQQGDIVEVIFKSIETGEWQLTDKKVEMKQVDFKILPIYCSVNGFQTDLYDPQVARMFQDIEDRMPKGISTEIEILEMGSDSMRFRIGGDKVIIAQRTTRSL